MGGAMARNKGARGERAVVKILQDIVTEEYSKVGLRPVELQRNLMQAYKTNGGEGNHDLVGVSWMALEVKHHETLHCNDWWDQTVRQAGENKEPILFYRKNNSAWRVRMYGFLLSRTFRVKTDCDIDLESFLVYFRMRLQEVIQGS